MAPKQAKAAKKKDAASKGRVSGGLRKLLLIAGVHIILAAAYAAYRQLAPYTPPEITPLRAPLMKELPEWDQQYKSNMLWGSYRSGLYFGMRTRSSRPLLLGLMWFDPSDPATIQQQRIRHEAQQGDSLQSYGWLVHDGRSYGRQELTDGDYQLSIQMVKSRSEGSGFGGDWAVRIRAGLSDAGKARAEAEKAAAESTGSKPRKRKLSLLLYLADAHWRTGEVEVWPEGQQAKLGEGVQLLAGDNEVVGPWALHLAPAPSQATGTASKGATSSRLHYLGMRLQDGQQLVQLKQLMLQALSETARRLGFDGGMKLRLPDISQPRPNLVVFQATAALPADFDLVFLSQPDEQGQERLKALTGPALTRLADEREQLFDSRFSLAFPTQAVPPGVQPAALQRTSKAALSNLLGSMGYFVGASRVQLPPGSRPYTPPGGREPGVDPSIVEYWRDALFTAVPSRSFFPRGFLWDEGFHQLLVACWDPQLSRDAISHWLDLMNKQGWIPREQVLGKEARARVPAEFLVQHPSHANPPSLFLPLLAHAVSVEGAAEDEAEVLRTKAFLRRAWPRLEAWYSWFNTSQAGQLPGSYMWKGRDASTERELNPKTLMSGLDDYPRASHPTPDERHIDLLAWMALASQAMAHIGGVAGAPAKAVAKYASAAAAIGSMERLRQFHFDADSGHFRDYGLHTEDVELIWRNLPQQPGQPPQREMVRQVNSAPKAQLVPSFGYVSLFPLLMQLVPADSPELGQQLQLLRDEALLWTPQGLRSLATTSSIYKKFNTEHDAPYWRGAIWININYLCLRALKHYGAVPGPHQAPAGKLHDELRSNLLTNLVRQYDRTGSLWEQYDDTDGKPKGSHPFTGWTALLTLIASDA